MEFRIWNQRYGRENMEYISQNRVCDLWSLQRPAASKRLKNQCQREFLIKYSLYSAKLIRMTLKFEIFNI